MQALESEIGGRVDAIESFVVHLDKIKKSAPLAAIL
jgi:hypothetical protein